MNNEEKILSILETLVSKVDKLEQGQANLEQELQTVKNTVIRIENQHGKKLDALSDSYIQLYDISKEIRQDFASLQVAQEKQDLHIKLLKSNRNG